MARTLYGPEVVTYPTTDDGDLAPYTSSMTAWTAETGGSQLTDLQTVAGVPVTSVTPDAVTGRLEFRGPDGYSSEIWLEVSGGVRWRVWPADLATRSGGVSSIAFNGGAPQTGAVTFNTPTVNVTSNTITDATATGKAVLTSTNAAAARTAIGAGTSNLAIGTTSTTAKAGNYAPATADISDATTTGRALVKAADKPTARTAIGALGTADVPEFGDFSSIGQGQIPVWDADLGTFVPGSQTAIPPNPFGIRGAVLNPGQAVPPDWPNGGIAFVRDAAPALAIMPAGANGVGNTSTTLATTLTESIETTDTLLVTFIAASPGSVLSTVTFTDAASGGTANTYTSRGTRLQGATVQIQEFTCHPGTRLPVGSSVTVTVGAAVGAISVLLTKMTGLANPSTDQLGQNGQAAIDRVTVQAGGATAQANELVTVAIGFVGVGNTVVDPVTWTQPGWNQIGTTQSSGGTNPKYAAIFYRTLTAIETVSVTPQVSAATGPIVAALISHKAA